VPRYVFACSREVISTSYSRNSVLKKLDRRSRPELIESSDVDEKVEDFVDSMALLFNGVMGFGKNISPCLKMETNLVLIVGERMMIPEEAVSRRGVRGGTDDVADLKDLMKGTGEFHVWIKSS
jgi:hypothetical protein